ncbi:MAG: rhomboid family intramembrane serine protease [Bacteriovoracaceae bacterium]|jgi:rhomboid protease GluP|nr:rhomboid family intramembrane serine protease [Bacteriovoracaceae bacterium]
MENSNKRLVRNFLSGKKDNKALHWSILALFTCLIMSRIYWSFNPGWGELLAASPDKVFRDGEYWRLFTSSFIHADLSHLLANSYMLGVMGYFVNYHYGAITYPILGFVAGIFINLIVISDFTGKSTLVGASGVVYYLWGFWLILYIFIQRHVPLNRRLMKVTAIGIFVLAPSQFKPQVSYYAHVVGLFLGMISGFTYYLKNRRQYHSYEVWEDIVEIVDTELEFQALNSDSKNR